MKTIASTLLIALAAAAGGAQAAEPLSPCGLVAEGGNARVYLDWNPTTFEQVVGYHVYRSEGGAKPARLTQQALTRPEFADETAKNGVTYAYSVSGVLVNGKETPISPAAVATPAEVTDPRRNGNTFIFADGQQIALDGNKMKLISWKSPDGQELALPIIYGSPIRLTEFDERGLSIPQPATEEEPAMTMPISKHYDKAQDARITVENGRVKVFYRIPLGGFGVPATGGHDSWIWASVWETWYPVERKIGPTVYRGIARRIELDVPTVYRDGFQLELNDGFGIGGSCKDSVSYRAFTWGSRMTIVHYDPAKGAAEIGGIRASYGRPFHPDQDTLNVHPFLFVDHPKGTLIFTAQRQHYAIHAALSNYADQKKDGLWPNFAVDLDNPGGRFCVDTLEYLFSPDRTLAAPQRYIDARTHFFRRIAHLYGYSTQYPGLCVGLRNFPFSPNDDLEARGEAEGKTLAAEGVDVRHDVHRTWLEAPYGTPELMHNADAPENRAIAAFNAGLKKHGVAAGFWFRPETVKSPRGNIFSDHFWSPYYGYQWQSLPPLIPLLVERGLPLIRNNTAWIRKARDGRYFDELAGRTDVSVAVYNWTPMSLKGGWYDEVLYPTFAMAQKLGFTSIFFDGGFGGFTGVDYTHGKAIAMQPYWTRVIRTACHFGLAPIGECGIGAGVMFCFGPSGESRNGKTPWMFANCPLMQDGTSTDEWMHKLHQLNALPFQDRGAHPGAHAFAREFVKANGAPDRIVLENLRLANEGDEQDHWAYDRVFWEYNDGRRVEYP